MEILANVTPLTVHIQEMALRSYIRVKTYIPAWDNLGRNNLRGHLHKTMKLASKLNIPLDNLDKIPLTFNPRTPFNWSSLTLVLFLLHQITHC